MESSIEEFFLDLSRKEIFGHYGCIASVGRDTVEKDGLLDRQNEFQAGTYLWVDFRTTVCV